MLHNSARGLCWIFVRAYMRLVEIETRSRPQELDQRSNIYCGSEEDYPTQPTSSGCLVAPTSRSKYSELGYMSLDFELKGGEG